MKKTMPRCQSEVNRPRSFKDSEIGIRLAGDMARLVRVSATAAQIFLAKIGKFILPPLREGGALLRTGGSLRKNVS